MNTLRERLKEVMDGPPKVTQSALAKACKVKPPSVSDWLSGRTKTLEGSNLLRAAAFLKVSPQWLATGKGPKEPSRFTDLDAQHDIKQDEIAAVSDGVIIPQYDAGGSMGNGLILDGMAGVIKSWHVDHEWLRLNVRQHTGINNLCIVTGFGPSMRPMFNPSDPLLVDCGVTKIDSDAVYFFRVGNHGYIKTIQRIPTADGKVIYRAKSKNSDFDPFDIVEGMDFEVFGKVLTVWKSEQF